MSLIKFALAGNYKRFVNDIKILSKDVKKNAFLLFLDMIVSTLITGSGLSDYLNYKFYEKKISERLKYATIGYQAKFYKKTCSLKYANFFSNKINFHKNFKKFTKRDFFDPSKGGVNELEAFLSKNPKFILKPIIGMGGTDVQKLSVFEISNKEKFLEKLKRKRFFLEEEIKQNETWSKLSPNSVNTIRVMTRIINNVPEIFFIASRIGSGKSIADNFHQGGMGVLVDIETGKLKGKGINKSLQEYEYSPITGIKFDGFKIPFFKEIKSMVLEAALINTKVAVMGWDVAIAKQGPLIIEGNRGPGFDMVQIILGKGTKYMLEKIKNNKT